MTKKSNPRRQETKSMKLNVERRSSETASDGDKSIAKGGVTTPFPWKLHDMLDAMDREGSQSIVCWQPHGRSFMVHKPKEFVDDIMPHFFNQTKYASFQRQLNLYGFSRLSHGRDKGAYYHQCFVRGERDLCRGMVRQKIKGTKVRRSLSPEEEPNFYLPEYNTKHIPTIPSGPLSLKTQAPPCEQPAPAPYEHPCAPPCPPPVQCPPSCLPQNPPMSTSLIMKPVQVKPDPSPPTSLVSMMKVKDDRVPVTTILPPPPPIKPLHQPRILNAGPPTPPPPLPPHSSSMSRPQQQTAKGGDLLFFEGLPFRYLEHIEELPPPPMITHTRPHYKETLHDMISSIVSMETSWTTAPEHHNACSV